MALEVRRIVTGHNSQGKAVVATDERLAGTGAAGRAGISRVDLWSTDKMPIDNSDAAAELQRSPGAFAYVTEPDPKTTRRSFATCMISLHSSSTSARRHAFQNSCLPRPRPTSAGEGGRLVIRPRCSPRCYAGWRPILYGRGNMRNSCGRFRSPTPARKYTSPTH